MTPLQRWWRDIEVSPSGCWLWTASRSDKGYGYHHDGGTHRAHRWGFQQLVRELSSAEHLDHTCHDASTCRPPAECLHRRCVNPAHLEVVSVAENNRRAMRDSCARGHVWTEASTIVRTAAGGRECRTCRTDRTA